MSAIDMFAYIDDVTGSTGEKRMVITLNGKVQARVAHLFTCATVLVGLANEMCLSQ